jgi:predicted aspartyl protease
MPIHIGKLSNNEAKFMASFIANVNDKDSLRTMGKVLIDTGATHTTVNKRIASDLKIKPVGAGTSLVVGATETTLESTFRLGIGVETLAGHTGMKLALISDALVFGDIELGNIDCLLGMDILADTALFMNGPEQTFTLAF